MKKKTTSCAKNTKKSKKFQRISNYVQKYSDSSKSTLELLLVKPHAWDQSNKVLINNFCNWVTELKSSKARWFRSFHKIHIKHKGTKFQIVKWVHKAYPSYFSQKMFLAVLLMKNWILHFQWAIVQLAPLPLWILGRRCCLGLKNHWAYQSNKKDSALPLIF